MIFGLITIIVLFLFYRFLRVYRPHLSSLNLIVEFVIISIFALSNIIYSLWLFDGQPYNVAIDPTSFNYELLAHQYILPLIIFYILFLSSLFIVWIMNWELPPIIILLCNCFLLIGVFISVKVIIHTLIDWNESTLWLCFVPFLNICLVLFFIFKLVRKELNNGNAKIINNKYLNKINIFLLKSSNLFLGIVLLTFPIYYLIILILIIFGQDSDTMTKAFTETSTWVLSQKEHPPYLDHNGHYLCTVAACGNPKNVKPLFVGKRHQNSIIVNRQLQIANAFEELIEVNFPKIHQIIRKNYDQYGYNLSRKINTKFYSDLTYYLMKPLEYFFLIFIYSFSLKPEVLIQKQYQDA